MGMDIWDSGGKDENGVFGIELEGNNRQRQSWLVECPAEKDAEKLPLYKSVSVKLRHIIQLLLSLTGMCTCFIHFPF